MVPAQARPAGKSVPFQTQWRIRDWWPFESQVAEHLTQQHAYITGAIRENLSMKKKQPTHANTAFQILFFLCLGTVLSYSYLKKAEFE